MESNEREQILREIEHNKLLRRLYQEHETLEKKLADFEGRSYLTVQEEVERSLLKKKKLFGVDRMMEILAKLRPSNIDGVAEFALQKTA